MKKVISVILVLIICCFTLFACGNDGVFDTQTKMEIAEFSLRSVVKDYNYFSFGRGVEITSNTTVGEIIDFLINDNVSVEYAYIDKNTKFLVVCEVDEDDEDFPYGIYKVKSGVSPSEYFSESTADLDMAKRIIAKDTFLAVLKKVDDLKLGSQIDKEMTIQEVVNLIESKGETVSTKHLNLSCVFRSAARLTGFEGISSTVYNDVEWLDFFAE